MNENKSNAKMFLGGIIIIAGLIAFFHKLEIFTVPLYDKLFSWEVLLIALGVYKLIKEDFTAAIILIGIGLFFGFRDYIPEIRKVFWPLVAIASGLVILLNNNKKKIIADSNSSNNISRRNLNFFGLTRLNVKGLSLEDYDKGVDVFTVFGKTEVIVDEDISVEFIASPIFGSVKDLRLKKSPLKQRTALKQRKRPEYTVRLKVNLQDMMMSNRF